MNFNVVVTCAVTGAGDITARSTKVPITPEQIANAALAAAAAGAAVTHIHVRDPETGKGSRDIALFRETVDRIRDSNPDVILNLTAGMGGDWTPHPDDPSMPGPGSDLIGAEERLAHIKEIRPEICTLDCGTLNFGDFDNVYIATPSILREMAGMIKAWGVKPELEVFELGHLRFATQLIREGLVVDPPLFQICLGIPWGADHTVDTMKVMKDQLPPGAIWAGFGISRMQMPMAATAMMLGGNVRVGLEDNLYLEKGVLASNGDLVTRVIEIIERLGGRAVTPAEARKQLHLRAAGA